MMVSSTSLMLATLLISCIAVDLISNAQIKLMLTPMEKLTSPI